MSKNGSINQIVDALMKLFVNRYDTHAIQGEDGSYRKVDKPLTKEVMKQHVRGEITIGCYQINPASNSVKWICFDIDPGRIKDATKVASKIFDWIREKLGAKAVLLEASRYSDPSYHIWVLFGHSIPASIGQYLGKRILKICELEKLGIELFPKQIEVREGGFGNLVKLPLGIHKRYQKKSCFLDPEKLEPVPNEILNSFNGVSCEEGIWRLLGKHNGRESKEIALVLVDYWLNFCEYSARKVWNLLERWNKNKNLSLTKESKVEIMRRASTQNGEPPEKSVSLNARTGFQKQTIKINQNASIFHIPCVKAFADTSILPCRRHDIIGKNFSILYQKINGSFQGFEDFTASLAKNQPGLGERGLDWRVWVQARPRSFNCFEVRNFLKRHVPEFSCSNCPVEAEAYYLHPAGGLNEFFVYEPIGQREYVFRTVDGKKGICKLGKEKEKYFLFIEAQKFFFEKKPPDTWFFHLPPRDTIQKWTNGEKKSKPLIELWKDVQLCLQTFLDIPNKHEFSALALFIIQSWISEISGTFFYCGIQGEWGGGKTVCGETTIQMCQHGYQTGNLTPAFVARAIEEQKLTLFVDELDSVAGTEDSDLYQIFRQGYRRGGSYARVNPRTMKTETFQIFGPKIFSIHSSVEPALQSRTLPIHVQETENPQFSVISYHRDEYTRKIHGELFLWYLDHAIEMRNNQFSVDPNKVDIVDQVDLPENDEVSLENISGEAEKLRKRLFEQSTHYLSEGQLNQLSQLKGRNVELAHIMMFLSNLVEVNINDDVDKIFEQKTTEESESLEIGRVGVLKDLLVDIWNEKKENDNYLTDAGYPKVSNKELYDRYNTALGEKNYPGVSTHEFKAYLTEFGFSDTLNRKKMKVLIPGEDTPKSRLCNIFTPRILIRLEIEKGESPEEDGSTATNEGLAQEDS